jgi:hypothetical protein
MAGQVSRPAASGWRVAAGFVLAVEALWWAGSAGVLVIGSLGLAATEELLIIVPVALMVVTLLAVFLLIHASRGGIWLGLSLQAIVGIHGLVLLVAFASLVGAFEIAVGVIAAVCLAAAANDRLRRRE